MGLRRGSLPGSGELLTMALDVARTAVQTNNRGAVQRAVALVVKVTSAMTSQSNGKDKMTFSNWLACLFGLGGVHDASYSDLYWDYCKQTAPENSRVNATASIFFSPSGYTGGGIRSNVTLCPEALSSTCYALCTVLPLLAGREAGVVAVMRVTSLARKVALDPYPVDGGKENNRPSSRALSFGKGNTGAVSKKWVDSVTLIKRAHDAVVVACKRVLQGLDSSQDPLKSFLLRERAMKTREGAGDMAVNVSEAFLEELEKKVPQWASELASTGMLPGG